MIVAPDIRGGNPMTGYAETYRRSLETPEEFWAEATKAGAVLPPVRGRAAHPGDAIAKSSRVAADRKRVSRVHKVAPGISRAAASRCASTYSMLNP